MSEYDLIVRGGEVVAAGSYDEVIANSASITGQYLSGAKRIEIPATRRKPALPMLRKSRSKSISVKPQLCGIRGWQRVSTKRSK